MPAATGNLSALNSLNRPSAPAFDLEDARRLAKDLYGLAAMCSDLPSYIDRNFRLEASDGSHWVLRIANVQEVEAALDLQNEAMRRLAARIPGVAPTVRTSLGGNTIERATSRDGAEHLVRLVSFLPGDLVSACDSCGPGTWRSLGELLGRIDDALLHLEHEAMNRELRWDLAHASLTIGHCELFGDAGRRALIEDVQLQFLGQVQRRMHQLPKSVIHNDANDQNLVLAAPNNNAKKRADPRVSGLFDFGDVVKTARIFELAIACAYAVLDQDEPLEVMAQMCAGYDAHSRLRNSELETLFPAMCMRLAQSVTISANDAALAPDNDYLRSSEDSAWRTLARLVEIEPTTALDAMRAACGRSKVDRSRAQEVSTPAAIQDMRGKHLGSSLSLAYDKAIELVRGRGSWLFDDTGRAYLDGVNNVCHVGHCHPAVVTAGQQQMEQLNTNTRYLHENIVRYAERLTSLFPEPLSVCFFVNSGSEANEVAVRMARAYTGRRDMVSLAGGYHGNTSTLIDLSPYKHDGPGGAGAPDWLYAVDCPDTYRGQYRAQDPEAAEKYAAQVAEACKRSSAQGTGIAALLVEPLIGCGGQIVPPAGYLSSAFAHARAAGALCIADEVQIGFGRVGSHMWGFELDGATPDIVTIGKPMGNGHPLAAVITTPEIAQAFAGGMEYFNTFGGNPVSCAIGMAVLDVIEKEGLRENAARIGARLLAGFEALAETHECIGDVRGVGLYIGVEIVKERESREPNAQLLARAIESARNCGLLFSSDGPDHNVLKIKPPICWTLAEADLALSIMDRALSQAAGN